MAVAVLGAAGCESGELSPIVRMGRDLESGRALFASADIPWLPDAVGRHRHLFVRYGRQHRVDPDLVAIVTLVESGGWIRARSPSGARGLMQVMPSTAQFIAAERGIASPSRDKLFEPAASVDLGAWYLAQQLEAFGDGEREGSVALAAAAYNGGPGTLRRHLDDGVELPAQTERYVHWVRSMWRERHLGESETYAAWYEAGGHRLVERARAEMRAARESPPAGQK
jgi:hypothetical protein